MEINNIQQKKKQTNERPCQVNWTVCTQIYKEILQLYNKNEKL